MCIEFGKKVNHRDKIYLLFHMNHMAVMGPKVKQKDNPIPLNSDEPINERESEIMKMTEAEKRERERQIEIQKQREEEQKARELKEKLEKERLAEKERLEQERRIREAEEIKKRNEKQKEKVNYYTLEEVKKHNTKLDAWLIHNDVVYDVTAYIGRHPGGQVIMKGVGGDATSLINRYHPRVNVAILLASYKVGILVAKLPPKK